MPWDQTEELFKSTLKAAAAGPSLNDDAWNVPTPKYEAVDLGEAGRQEIWETGPARIEKLIAKHGGKQPSRLLQREPRCWRARGAH
jgi:abhydrolase domain-containing protein 12